MCFDVVRECVLVSLVASLRVAFPFLLSDSHAHCVCGDVHGRVSAN